MEPCRTYACVIKQLRERGGYNSSDDLVDGNGGLFSSSSSFRILLPILLVLGVFIIIAVGLLMHRIILKVVKKRWHSQTGSHVTPSDPESGSRSGRVNTVSGDYGDLPSYGQVMEAIEREELPPPYYQVINGVVNLGFINEDGRSVAQSPSNEPRDVNTASSPVSSNQNPPHHNEPTTERTDSSGNMNPTEVTEAVISGEAEVLHIISQETNITSSTPAVGPSYYRSTMPPVEEPLSIVIHDIDDVIDSISVATELPTDDALHNRPSVRIDPVERKRRKGHHSIRSALTGQCTSFSASVQTSVPKTPTDETSERANDESSITLESTPV